MVKNVETTWLLLYVIIKLQNVSDFYREHPHEIEELEYKSYVFLLVASIL